MTHMLESKRGDELVVPDKVNPLWLGISGEGISLGTQDSQGKTRATRVLPWAEWNQIAAWIEWQKREQAPS